MGGFITVLNENKKYYAAIALVLAIAINVVYSAFSSGPSQLVLDKMEEGKQDGLRMELLAEASGSVQVKMQAIEKLQKEVVDLDICQYQISEEMHTKIKSKPCSQRSYVSGSGSTIEVSTNSGTEATPTPVKEEKPQA